MARRVDQVRQGLDRGVKCCRGSGGGQVGQFLAACCVLGLGEGVAGNRLGAARTHLPASFAAHPRTRQAISMQAALATTSQPLGCALQATQRAWIGARRPSRGARRVETRGGRQTPSAPAARRTSRAAGRRSVVVLAQQQPRSEGPSRRQQLAGLAALAAAVAARPAQAGLFDGGKAAAERYEKDTVRGEGAGACLLPRTHHGARRCGAALATFSCPCLPPTRSPTLHGVPAALPCCAQAQIITNVRNAATLERDAANREEIMADVRKQINDWVARYRR